MISKTFQQKLKDFLNRATKATYAGGGPEVNNPQRPGFTELTYSEGDFEYRDSYTGHTRSHGTEIVRYKGKVVHATSCRGGMVEGKEKMAGKTFSFLKKAMSVDERGFWSARGPHHLTDGDWKYVYTQKGDFDEFEGHEEIYYRNELVFFHKVIGGTVKHK